MSPALLHKNFGEHTMDAGKAVTAVNLRYGGSSHPETKQKHLNDLRNPMNSLRCKSRAETRRWPGSTAAPWPASTGGHRYGAPVRKKMKEGHRKDRELTASP